MSFEAAVHAKATQLNRLSLEMCAEAGSGHPTSAMSLGHIVTVLLYHTMRWLPDHPTYGSSDRLVLSEGHAVPIIYAAIADIGGSVGEAEAMRPLTKDDLATLRDTDSVLDGHPNPRAGFPFFDTATGSLGQGLSQAAGLALAARDDELDKRIYCIVGDGESREGQIAEALDFIVDYKLTNLLPIFNCNGFGQADKVSNRQSPDVLQRKLEAYGFDVKIVDGHDPGDLREAMDTFVNDVADHDDAKPLAIVAKTVKGWGAQSLQGGGWHGKPPTGDQLNRALEELSATSVNLTSTLAGDELRIYPPGEFIAPVRESRDPMSFEQAMNHWDMAMTLKTGRFATRKAYGMALRALGHANPNVYALDGDVRNSTFVEWFANDAEINDRAIECKIAEQNMFSVAAGLSAAGKIPFCSTFGKFVARGYDQIEMAINSGANINIIGSHTGISPAADGPSQMALPDIAWFRSWASITDHHGTPGCYVLQPADAYAAYALTMKMAEHPGACYMRVHRPDVEFLYSENTEFELGEFEVLTEGRDLLIVTAGFMVHECNEAIEALDKAGIDASLVDLYSIPFDRDRLMDLANENNGNILTVEDNYGASLGSAVADACTESGDAFTLEQMFVRKIPKSSRTPEQMLQQCGLHADDIVRRACEMLRVPAGV